MDTGADIYGIFSLLLPVGYSTMSLQAIDEVEILYRDTEIKYAHKINPNNFDKHLSFL